MSLVISNYYPLYIHLEREKGNSSLSHFRHDGTMLLSVGSANLFRDQSRLYCGNTLHKQRQAFHVVQWAVLPQAQSQNE